MTIELLNQKHAGFLKQHLGGPIRNPRSWSKTINLILPYLTLFSAYRYRENLQSLRLEKK